MKLSEAILNKTWGELIGKTVTLIGTLVVTDFKTNKNIQLNPGDIVKIIDSSRVNHDIKTDITFIEFKGKKYISHPEALLSKSNLNESKQIKENKPGTTSSYRQEITWIENEVDFVPDDKEMYMRWPEPWRTRALKALKNRAKNFDQMTKNKLKRYESKQFKLADIAKKLIERPDINDPVLMAQRTKKDQVSSYGKKPSNSDINRWYDSIDKLYDRLDQARELEKELFSEMENDPDIEMEGGPVADKYGDQLNKLNALSDKIKLKIKEYEDKIQKYKKTFLQKRP